MGFGNLGFGEILIILIVVLLLFGAKRIPEIAGSFGKGIREFKKSVNEVQSSVQADVAPPRDDRDRLRQAGSPSGSFSSDGPGRLIAARHGYQKGGVAAAPLPLLLCPVLARRIYAPARLARSISLR